MLILFILYLVFYYLFMYVEDKKKWMLVIMCEKIKKILKKYI